MEWDDKQQRLTLKIVYYGPALSGKTTNVMTLHDCLASGNRGDLVALDTHQDRTLFFDLLPFFFKTPSGLALKLKVYTVPGQVRYDATRKTVLSRADGVVFVADSQTARQTNNAENFENLEQNCHTLGLELEQLPLVVQYNKRDLPDIVSENEVRERWGAAGVPVVFASALKGMGVAATFEQLARALYRKCDEQLHLAAAHGLDEAGFLACLGVKHG